MASSKAYYKTFTITVLLLSLTLISLAGNAEDTDVRECKTESRDSSCRNNKEAQKLKLKAIISIFAVSISGVCLPLLIRSDLSLGPNRHMFVIARGLASGALETGVMHVLPDSLDYLTSEFLPEYPWRKFPFTTFIALASDLFPFMFNLYAMSLYKKMTSDMDKKDEVNDDNTSQRRRNTDIVLFVLFAQMFGLGMSTRSLSVSRWEFHLTNVPYETDNDL